MAKLLAIEWDEREVRVAVASPRGGEVVVDEAFAIDIAAISAADSEDDSHAVGQRVAEVLSQRGLTGSDALVGLGRTSIELRSISLPPAPPEELPDMVRFQAMQAFTSIGEDWPLDFVELGAQDESLNVLAAVVSPQQVAQIMQVCAASELKVRSLVLRPFAATSLLNRGQVLSATGNALILDLLADAVDLTAVSQGQVVFMRTVRLPASEDRNLQARALAGEARRTIAAAQAQMSGQRIEQVILCGGPTEHAELVQAMGEALALDVTLFDPFQAVRLAPALERQLPPDPGRYAPLLGMLADEAAGVRHAIDFLNPRRRPVARSNRRRNMLIAGGSAAVAAVIVLGVWGGLRRLDGQIATLTEKGQELDKQVTAAEALVERANSIAEFTDKDVTWLDEVREMAILMPDADHVMLRDVQLATPLKRGAVMTLGGNAKTPEAIEQFENSLRYGDNVVDGRGGPIDRKQTEYRYSLDTTVTLSPDKYDAGRSLGRAIREEMRKDALRPAAEPAEEAGPPTTGDRSPPASKPKDTAKAQATGGSTS